MRTFGHARLSGVHLRQQISLRFEKHLEVWLRFGKPAGARPKTTGTGGEGQPEPFGKPVTVGEGGFQEFREPGKYHMVAVSYKCPSGEGLLLAIPRSLSFLTPQKTTYLASPAQNLVGYLSG